MDHWNIITMVHLYFLDVGGNNSPMLFYPYPIVNCFAIGYHERDGISSNLTQYCGLKSSRDLVEIYSRFRCNYYVR